MKTITLTPHVGGLTRWLRAMYASGDRANAVRIIRAGWPTLTDAAAVQVLTNAVELRAALAAAESGQWADHNGHKERIG